MPLFATAEGVAAITAGATLIGAGGLASVTMYTTVRRLREEREAQERELVAEAARQRTALAHDRELADLADLRSLLDEAALVLDRARGARIRAATRVDALVTVGDQEERNTLFGEESNALHEARRAARAISARLKVRLGPEDAMTAAFAGAEQAVRGLSFYWTALLIRRSEPAECRAGFFGASSAFLAASKEFERATVERAGSMIAQREV